MELWLSSIYLGIRGSEAREAETRHPSSLQAASSVRRTGKRASMMSALCQGNGCMHRPGALQRAGWRVLACGLFRDKDVRLMKRLAAARGGVGLRRQRHGDQERAERCAGAVPLLLSLRDAGVGVPDAEPAT